MDKTTENMPKEPRNFSEDLTNRASIRLINAIQKKCTRGQPVGPEHAAAIAAVTEHAWRATRGFGAGMVDALRDVLDDWDLEMGTPIPAGQLPAENPGAVTIDERAQLLIEARDECKAHLEIVRVRREELPPGGFDYQLTAAVNTLSKSVSQLNAEARQQEKHEASIIENLSDEQQDEVVKDFLENISKSRRRALVEWASELDIGTGLLGH